MTAIKPGEGTTKWATISEAEKLPSSKGVKQLRADVLTIADMGGKTKNIDLTNHFLIRVAENKIYTSSKPLVKQGLFRNKVAMKVGKDNTGKDQYVILNINSLSKRLGISKTDIRQAEKKGNVNGLVEQRLLDLSKQQTEITKIIKNIKESLSESNALTLEDDEKTLLNEFVSTHFEDPVLRKGISTFSEKKFGTENDPQAQQFLDRLISKVWWNAPDLIKVEDHEKLSLTKETLGDISWGERVFKGAALKRPGNAGNEMRRARVLPWDTKQRYAIAIGDYVYSTRPTPRSSKEVPIVMDYDFDVGKGQWVLANVNSLKRLGFSTKEVRAMHKKGTLDDAIISRLEVIDQFNEVIKKNVDIDDVKKFAKEHPDKGVRKILNSAVKEYNKIEKGYKIRKHRELRKQQEQELKKEENEPEIQFHKKQYLNIYLPHWKQAVIKNLSEAGAIQGES